MGRFLIISLLCQGHYYPKTARPKGWSKRMRNEVLEIRTRCWRCRIAARFASSAASPIGTCERPNAGSIHVRKDALGWQGNGKQCPDPPGSRFHSICRFALHLRSAKFQWVPVSFFSTTRCSILDTRHSTLGTQDRYTNRQILPI